jgi:hypothetical protein
MEKTFSCLGLPLQSPFRRCRRQALQTLCLRLHDNIHITIVTIEPSSRIVTCVLQFLVHQPGRSGRSTRNLHKRCRRQGASHRTLAEQTRTKRAPALGGWEVGRRVQINLWAITRRRTFTSQRAVFPSSAAGSIEEGKSTRLSPQPRRAPTPPQCLKHPGFLLLRVRIPITNATHQ